MALALKLLLQNMSHYQFQDTVGGVMVQLITLSFPTQVEVKLSHENYTACRTEVFVVCPNLKCKHKLRKRQQKLAAVTLELNDTCPT